jgi:hypothetical protein
MESFATQIPFKFLAWRGGAVVLLTAAQIIIVILQG